MARRASSRAHGAVRPFPRERRFTSLPVDALAAIALSVLVAASCSTPGPTSAPETGSPVGSRPSALPSTSEAPASITSVAPTTTASAAAPWAGAPVVGLARLPARGAFYASVRLPAIDAALSLMPTADRRALLRDLEQTVPGAAAGLADAVARQFDLDSSRSLLATGTAPDLDPLRSAMSRISTATTTAGYEAAVQQAASHAVTYRIVLPLRPGGDARKGLRLVVDQLLGGGPIERCPESKGCAAFGAAAPSALGYGRRGGLAAYASASDVEIDVAIALFVDGTSPSLWPALAAMRKAPLGGPQGSRCGALDGSALASVCVDADAMAALAVATAYGQVARAVAGAGVEPGLRRTITEQGRKEAEQALRLAQPTRRLLDDGTASLRVDAGQLRARLSWALTKEVREPVAAAFGAERCVAHASEARGILVPLRDAFGGVGADFADPRARLRDVQEAGWGAWPVLFARTWPNFLGLDALLDPSRELAKELDRARLCISIDGERLVVSTDVAAGG